MRFIKDMKKLPFILILLLITASCDNEDDKEPEYCFECETRFVNTSAQGEIEETGMLRITKACRWTEQEMQAHIDKYTYVDDYEDENGEDGVMDVKTKCVRQQ
jgi:hypothetical protein